MKVSERIDEILEETSKEEIEETKTLKEIIREWFLRNIITKKGLIHLLTLQDIEMKEIKGNNTYLRKEKKKYKDLCVEQHKELRKRQIEINRLKREIEVMKK